jgi:septal ring factor EnvC (AmiA/AmiB activator)
MIEAILTLTPGGAVALLLVGALATTGALAMAAVASFKAESAQRRYEADRSRLPAATQLADVTERLALKRQELADLEARLAETRKQVTDADRARMEYEHWRSLAEATKAEHSDLGSLRQEIDSVRDEYERLAALLAERRAELASIISEREEVSRQRDDLKKQIGHLDDRKAELAEIEARIVEASKKRDSLRAETADLDERRAELHRIEFENAELAKKKADFVNRIETLGIQLPLLQQKRDALEADVARLSTQVSGLERLRIEYAEIEAKLADLRPRLGALEAEIHRLQAERDGIAKEGAQLRSVLASDRSEANRLHQTLVAQRAEAEALDSRRAELSAHIANLQKRIGDIGPSYPGTDGPSETLADLFVKPTCLFTGEAKLLAKASDTTDERKVLDQVRTYLDRLGFIFDDRVLLRFHTSLKIGRISPLTVLAGISGTGKSQLPQRYAEAMGIHFLKLAVQPRWDSPQDLLGFYNYLEKRYKATDLSRALLCMDETLAGKEVQNGGSMSDRVLLVLLDEMNIARVEYYFSEFLSRLEGRPEHGDTDDAKKRAARIEIEVPGQGRAVAIYPGHNVLFAGTMNQDESTQSLSDKVLDRGNTLLFRKPDKLTGNLADGGDVRPTDVHLPMRTWRSWQRAFESLSPTTQASCQGIVEKLNSECKAMRRPFGYRVAQSIFAYVANHPDAVSDGGARLAMADMVEMRLLPKLRGVNMEGDAHGAVLRIAEIVGKDLSDTVLAQRIREGAAGDVFDWTAA